MILRWQAAKKAFADCNVSALLVVLLSIRYPRWQPSNPQKNVYLFYGESQEDWQVHPWFTCVPSSQLGKYSKNSFISPSLCKHSTLKSFPELRKVRICNSSVHISFSYALCTSCGIHKNFVGNNFQMTRNWWNIDKQVKEKPQIWFVFLFDVHWFPHLVVFVCKNVNRKSPKWNHPTFHFRIDPGR